MSPEEILNAALTNTVKLAFVSAEDAVAYRFRLYNARQRFREDSAKTAGDYTSPWENLSIAKTGEADLTISVRAPKSDRAPIAIEQVPHEPSAPVRPGPGEGSA